jgi:hypothetical protein
LDAGSLILISPPDLLMVFLGFFDGGGVVVALCLPAREMEDLAPGLEDESSVDSSPESHYRKQTIFGGPY